MKEFFIQRVVTKDIATDFFQGLRNFFGMRQRGYEHMLQKNITEMQKEMRLRYKNIKWWRMIINPLTTASVMIIIYGEEK